MITDSLRGQLTLWYTGVLALVLIVFAVATYQYLARTGQQRTDRSLADSANAFIATLISEASDENQSLSAAATETANTFYFPDRQIIVYDQQRKVVAASKVPDNIGIKEQWFSPAELSFAVAKPSQSYLTLPNKTEGIRLFAVTAQIHGQPVTVLVAQSLKEQAEALEQARGALFIAVPLALLIATMGGYFLARKSLAPVLAISNQAARIGVANLEERLPVPHARNELSQLAQIFNDLLARLDRSFAQQRRFMADASHELRTPVAIVRGESEVALARADRSPEEYREALRIVHEESQRLGRVVEDLFTLARADAGQYPPVKTDLYLDEMIGDCLRSVRSLAIQRNLHLDYDPQGRAEPFRGDEALLRRMLLNLLDNSMKYTAAGGSIHVTLNRENQEYSISVTDTGVGIPAEAQSQVFDRFFRINKARSREDEIDGSGAGLGLSIAAWIAEIHAGRISLDHSDQNGTTFIVYLPQTQ